MATLTATRAKTGFPAGGVGPATSLHVATGTYEVAANPSASDVIEMCKLPAGAVVVMGWIMADDLDTNATATLDIDLGWASNGTESANASGFGNLGVWNGTAVTDVKPETANWFPLGGVLHTTGPQLFSAETTIQFTVNAAAATGGTGTVTVVMLYFVDPNYVTT